MIQRMELWRKPEGTMSNGYPSCFFGDFSVLLEASEKRGGNFTETCGISEFRDFILN